MKTTTIKLIVETVVDVNPFGEEITTEVTEDVKGCLVGQPTTDDITSSVELYGKKCEYVVGIPKGDTHDWKDRELYIWGERFRTIGFPMTGIQENIPLRWGQNVKVERYG